MRVLTVINPFAGYALGDTITDTAQVDAILAGEQSQHVIASERDEPAKRTSKNQE